MPAGNGEAPSAYFDGVVEAGPGWAGASRIELHLDGGPDGPHSIVVDDALFVPHPDCGRDLVANGAIGGGTPAPFAPTRGAVGLSLLGCLPGGDGCSLAADADYWRDGVTQAVPSRCFAAASQEWTMPYDVRLLDKASGDPLPCPGGIRCPMVRMRSTDRHG